MASRSFAAVRYALIALAALSATELRADWLVLRDGSRVETRGGWTERGATLVFYNADGKLASLRLTEVDLDASVAATAEAVEAARRARETPPPPPPPPKKPVLVVTDADIPRADPAEIAAAAAAVAASAPAAAADATTPSAAASTQERLKVTSWSEERNDSTREVAFVGEVLNTSTDVAGNLKVTAMLYDTEGGLLATADALTGTSVLRPGQHTNFRANFPGVYSYGEVRFTTDHFAVSEPSAPVAPGEAGGEEADGATADPPAPRRID